jgi:hypothetical protein
MITSAEKFGQSLDPPITKQRVYQLITRGDLVLTAKKIDTDNPRNAAWIAARRTSTPPHRGYQPAPEVRRAGRPPSNPSGYSGRKAQQSGDGEDETDSLAGIDVEEVLSVMATMDVRRFHKVDIDKLKNLEALLKVRVERQHKRRELIERSLVQSVFGKLYQIDSAELGVLGARLAPAVAGLFGVDDAELTLRVEQMIDVEVMKTKSHIKRLLGDFLIAQGANGDLHD